MTDSEKDSEHLDLKKLSNTEVLEAAISYIEIAANWDFEEAEVVNGKWVRGAELAAELRERIARTKNRRRFTKGAK